MKLYSSKIVNTLLKKMITIQELLFNRGLDKIAKTKLVRHKDSRNDLYNLYCNNKEEFLAYQKHQGKDVFKDLNFIVSFIGESGKSARFIGVFKILDTKKLKDGSFWYEMEEVNGYEDLRERVIINWGNASMSWHQWISNTKAVMEIHPGLHYQQFTDYFDFILKFKELQEIVTNQYSDWKKVLSITKGVYLITDSKTGKLYIGSAYGEDGIWGRWTNYVFTKGHGNNKMLIELLKKDISYASNFRFSILMLLPKTITPDEAIKKEKLFKTKLGTNSFGLNEN